MKTQSRSLSQTEPSSGSDRNKLLVGLMRATIKRDIDTKKLNEIVDDIEVELRSSHTDGRHVP